MGTVAVTKYGKKGHQKRDVVRVVAKHGVFVLIVPVVESREDN